MDTEAEFLNELREATRRDLEDFEAGRFHTFVKATQLQRHFTALAEQALTSTATHLKPGSILSLRVKLQVKLNRVPWCFCVLS